MVNVYDGSQFCYVAKVTVVLRFVNVYGGPHVFLMYYILTIVIAPYVPA